MASTNFFDNRTEDRIIISGKVLRVGDTPSKGSKWFLRFVQYKVQEVCEGKYDKEEIIVSHLPEPKLDRLKEGENVCIVVGKSVGPTINDDWSVDFHGKETQYINDGLFIENCECHHK